MSDDEYERFLKLSSEAFNALDSAKIKLFYRNHKYMFFIKLISKI